MKLIVNDEPVEITGTTVEDLVEHLTGNAEEAGMAVAVEGQVIPRTRWDTLLTEGARVDVLTAVQGG